MIRRGLVSFMIAIILFGITGCSPQKEDDRLPVESMEPSVEPSMEPVLEETKKEVSEASDPPQRFIPRMPGKSFEPPVNINLLPGTQYRIEYGPNTYCWVKKDNKDIFCWNMKVMGAAWGFDEASDPFVETDELETLLTNIELKAENFSEKVKMSSPEIDQIYCFSWCIYDAKTRECPVLLTEEGDVYIFGYLYTGEKENFCKALQECIVRHAIQDGRKERQRKLLDDVLDLIG